MKRNNDPLGIRGSTLDEFIIETSSSREAHSEMAIPCYERADRREEAARAAPQRLPPTPAHEAVVEETLANAKPLFPERSEVETVQLYIQLILMFQEPA